MKKQRMRYIFLSFFLIFCTLLFSSNYFKVKNVEILCENKNEVNLGANNLELDLSFFYGEDLLFNNFFDKKKLFEQRNPNYKLINIKKNLPNELILNVFKRLERFFVTNDENVYILDEEFKIIKIDENKNVSTDSLIEICGENQNYFDFFDVYSATYFEGLFLSENNLAFTYLTNFCDISSNFSFLSSIKKVMFFNENQMLNLKILTFNEFGITLVIENIENKFDYKLKKVINALFSLGKNEKIKTTYGKLIIDNNCNCKWLKN